MNFKTIDRQIISKLKEGYTVAHSTWQSIDVSNRPELQHVEVLNHSFTYPLLSAELEYYQQEISPNLPWADKHFDLERSSGEPLNPGTTWKEWPYAASAGTHLDNQIFDHSYAERYWPKQAGKTRGGKVGYNPGLGTHKGIRGEYGDLDDLVDLLINDPLTRQAYLPVWFPEDLTAAKLNKRVPCSLGYHFIIREGLLHVVYYIRSCDYIRHFRDDVYLTIRLLLWILERINEGQEIPVAPGTLTMHITSLHIFQSDYTALFGVKT
jgi:thymidylate synthase